MGKDTVDSRLGNKTLMLITSAGKKHPHCSLQCTFHLWELQAVKWRQAFQPPSSTVIIIKSSVPVTSA